MLDLLYPAIEESALQGIRYLRTQGGILCFQHSAPHAQPEEVQQDEGYDEEQSLERWCHELMD